MLGVLKAKQVGSILVSEAVELSTSAGVLVRETKGFSLLDYISSSLPRSVLEWKVSSANSSWDC